MAKEKDKHTEEELNETILRKDEDLDSVTYGTPGTGQLKVYFNAKENSEDELVRRIALAIKGLKKAIELKAELNGD